MSLFSKAPSKANVFVQIIVFVAIAAFVMFFIKSHSIGSVILQNAGSIQSAYQLDIRASSSNHFLSPVLLPAGEIKPGSQVEVSLDSLAWQKVSLQVWDTAQNSVIPGTSQEVFIVPGGKVLKTTLTHDQSSANNVGWAISEWTQE